VHWDECKTNVGNTVPTNLKLGIKYVEFDANVGKSAPHTSLKLGVNWVECDMLATLFLLTLNLA
jgi:hypothetical protein